MLGDLLNRVSSNNLINSSCEKISAVPDGDHPNKLIKLKIADDK